MMILETRHQLELRHHWEKYTTWPLGNGYKNLDFWLTPCRSIHGSTQAIHVQTSKTDICHGQTMLYLWFRIISWWESLKKIGNSFYPWDGWPARGENNPTTIYLCIKAQLTCMTYHCSSHSKIKAVHFTCQLIIHHNSTLRQSNMAMEHGPFSSVIFPLTPPFIWIFSSQPCSITRRYLPKITMFHGWIHYLYGHSYPVYT